MRRRVVFLGLFLGTLIPLTWTSLVGASGPPPGTASYDGKTIVLSQSWAGAQACAVYSPSDVRCFDTESQMRATLAPDASTPSGAASPLVSGACDGYTGLWLYLYQDINYGGRVLAFQDVNYWQNLSTYGFADQMSSWINNTYCTAYGATGANGGGSWLTMARQSANPWVGSAWNDAVASIDIVE